MKPAERFNYALGLYQEGRVVDAAIQMKKAGSPEEGVAQVYRAVSERGLDGYEEIGRLLASRWGVEYPDDIFKRQRESGARYNLAEKEKFASLEEYTRQRIRPFLQAVDIRRGVLDIGARDGRYVDTLREFGFREVICVEPDASEAEKIVGANKVVVGSFAEFLTLDDNPEIGTAVVLNMEPVLATSDEFTIGLVDFLNRSRGRRLVLSFAEELTYDRFKTIALRHGLVETVNSTKEYRDGVPHHVMSVFASAK